MSETIKIDQAAKLCAQVREKIGAYVYGQEDLLNQVLCCLWSGGHVLMTGAPGLAKTTLVRVIARQLGVNFGRVQFTPDLLPGDITGSEILQHDQASNKRKFEFVKGPIFTNLLLADEINRASPRTQSALLEAMQEHAVTVGGHRHTLQEPFMVFATQNPFESEGTFPLPEAQLDRFLIHALVEYPKVDAELRILQAHADSQLIGESAAAQKDLDSSSSVLSAEELQSIQACTRAMPIDKNIIEGINRLTRSTRPNQENCPEVVQKHVWYGAGPRAGLSLISTAKALALMEGSDSVRWRHIREMACPTLRHRLRLYPSSSRTFTSPDQLILELVAFVESEQKNLSHGL